MRASDSNTITHTAHVDPTDKDYKIEVAEPVMQAVDGMPAEYRALVHEFGYVEVYRRWKRGLTVDEIRYLAKNGGLS